MKTKDRRACSSIIADSTRQFTDYWVNDEHVGIVVACSLGILAGIDNLSQHLAAELTIACFAAHDNCCLSKIEVEA